MPGENNQKDNPGYVTRAEFNIVKDEICTIRTALVGKDYRGGIVKDVADLKKTRSTTSEFIKCVIVPITVAVVTALIITGISH